MWAPERGVLGFQGSVRRDSVTQTGGPALVHSAPAFGYHSNRLGQLPPPLPRCPRQAGTPCSRGSHLAGMGVGSTSAPKHTLPHPEGFGRFPELMQANRRARNSPFGHPLSKASPPSQLCFPFWSIGPRATLLGTWSLTPGLCHRCQLHSSLAPPSPRHSLPQPLPHLLPCPLSSG